MRLNGALAIGAIARDSAIERAPWIGEREWSLLHDVSRVVADPVVRQMATVVGSLCHNDPAGDWTTVALAARAEVIVRGKGGTRTVAIDEFLVDSFTTAVGDGEMALAVRFPMPTIERRARIRRVERKVGDFATAAAAVQVSLERRRHDRAGRHRVVGGGSVRGSRRRKPSSCSTGQKPSRRPHSRRRRRGVAPQRSRRPICAAASNTRRHLAGVLVARGLRQALSRLGVQA